jgi:hypothetical protein
LDIVVFQLPPPCTQLHDCDTSLVGVGHPETIFADNARMVYCCWPEAMDGDLCQEDQQGRLILDNRSRGGATGNTASKFVGTHKTIVIPGDGVVAAFLYGESKLTALPEGTYGLILANCNYQHGRQIHVTGGVHWTPKLDDPIRDDEYHKHHEEYHDGGVRDHGDVQDHHTNTNTTAETTQAPAPAETIIATTIAPGTVGESVILVPPGADGETEAPSGGIVEEVSTTTTPPENGEATTTTPEQGETTTAPTDDGETTTTPPEEKEIIDETVDLVVPSPGPNNEGMETGPLPGEQELVVEEPQEEEQEQQEKETDDDGGGGGGGGISAIAAVAGVLVVVIVAVLYYRKRRNNQRANGGMDVLDLMYAMDEGCAPPSIDDADNEALLYDTSSSHSHRAHRDYRRPSCYMDDPDAAKQQNSYSHRPVTHLSTLL